MACLSACQVRGHAQTTGEKKEDGTDGSFQGYGKEDKGQLRASIFVTSGCFWTICACLGFLLSHSPAVRSFQMTRGPWVPGPEAMPCMLQYRGFWKFRAPGWSFFFSTVLSALTLGTLEELIKMQKEGASLTPYIFVEPCLVPGCVVDTRIMAVETERDVDPGLQR